MANGQAVLDDNNKPTIAGWDATGHQVATAQIVSVSTDSTTGAKYGALSISGTISATNPSVGTDGSAIPTSSTLLGASDGTNLQPLQVDGSKFLKVNVAAGSISASNPSVGTDGSAIPTSSTLIGASDGTNLQQLLVESASHPNMRIGLYSGANEATVTGANALKVDNSAVTQPVSGTVTMNAGSGTMATLDTNSASIKADLDTINTSTANIPAKGQATMSGSTPVAIASDQSSVPIKQPTSATGTLSSVAGTVSASTQLLASNTSRKGMYVFNESTAILYLGFSATVTTTSYTVQIPANGFFEMPTSPVYTGVIAGVWSAANGNARITELS